MHGTAGTADESFDALLRYLRDSRGFEFTGYKRAYLPVARPVDPMRCSFAQNHRQHTGVPSEVLLHDNGSRKLG